MTLDSNPLTTQVFARKIIHAHRINRNQSDRVVHLERFWKHPPKHPNLISVFRWGQIPNIPEYYIDMELADDTLQKYMSSHTEQGIQDIFAIMFHITEGLHFLHSRTPPVVHQRLNPRNGTSSA
jgi:serine/threonine protein kinase